MRIQHILIGCLLCLCVCSVWFTMVIQIENDYNITRAELFTNDTNTSEIIHALDIYDDGIQEEYTNASRSAPGNRDAAQQDPSSSTTAISQSSWTTGMKFARSAFSLPGTLLTLLNKVIPIDPKFTQTLIISLTVMLAFIMISAVFFNKL